MHRRRLFRRVITVVLVAVAVTAAAVMWMRNGTRTVTLAQPTRGAAVEAVYATGTVEPVIQAAIGPVAAGRIAEILVEEDDEIRQGQPLARLDDREARARVAELEARAAFLRDEVERARALAERGIKTRTDEARAESEYRQVVAAIAAARQKRLDLLVTSPIDGRVLRRDGEVGEVAELSDTLFWIGQPRPLRISGDVDEEDIAKVHPDQEVLVKADAFPDRVLTGRVESITPKGDPVAKTFRVRVALPDDTPLMVGMTTEINIVTAEHRNALLVPAGALVNGHVFVLDEGTAQRRKVATGIHGKESVEILDGLTGGETVVDNPPATLKAGDRIRGSGAG